MINFDIKSKILAFEKDHNHQTNIWLHLLAIPVFVIGLIGVIYAIKFPIYLREDIQLNLAHIVGLVWFLYYFNANKTWSVGMLVLLIIAFWVQYNFEEIGYNLLSINCLFIFIAIIVMFVGHKTEENISAFKNDILKIVYSPAWFINYILQSLELDN